MASRRILFSIFFLSGISGLIYESIWSHYLKLFLGHAAYAQTLVLAIFMGGMAVGAWTCGRYSHRWRNLLLAYALVEGFIGVSAFLFHDLFTWMVGFSFDAVLPSMGSVATIQAYKWILCGLLILPQSIMLGMTFPLMSGGALRQYPQEQGKTISLLYFVNSLGGAIGVLLSGFLTIRIIGLQGTLFFAGMINVLLAAVVWYLFRFSGKNEQGLPKKASESRPSDILVLMLVVSMLTGLASFVYEIAWIRMLSLVLGSSTHAFELMLSAFILGLALGGLWIRGRIDAIRDKVLFLGGVQVVMGLAVLATLPIYGNSFEMMKWLVSIIERTPSGYFAFNIASHGLAMLVMLPAAFCAGTTLPLITYVLLQRGTGEKAIGYVYGINTLGAILGIVLVVHLLIPALGLKGALISGTLVDIALGLFLIHRQRRALAVKWRAIVPSAAVASLLGAILFVEISPHKMVSGVYRDGNLLAAGSTIVQYADGKTASISVTSDLDNKYSLRTNGKTDGSIQMAKDGVPSFDEVTMTLIGAIPLLLRPEAETVAIIGFGTGMTTHTVLANPNIEKVDNVEIELEVIKAAGLFRPYNERAFTDSRSEIFIEDAKTFFSTRQKRYDIIISEPSNPWVSGTSGLFSEEFYKHIKRYLTKDGVIGQWLQVYEFDINLLASVIKALESQFNYYSIYAVDHGDLLIIGSDSVINEVTESDSFGSPEMVKDLARIGVRTPQDIRVRWIGDRKFFAPLFDSIRAPANSDFSPYLDQNAAKARFLKADAHEVFFPAQSMLPFRPLLKGREISSGSTDVTPTRLYPYSAQPFAATYIHRALTGVVPEILDRFPELDEEIKKIDIALEECQEMPEHGDRIYVALQLVSKVLPYLSPTELGEVFDAISRKQCGAVDHEHEIRWWRLLTSVAQRDTQKMWPDVDWLLQRPDLLSRARGSYLFGLGMLGLIADGDWKKAQDLWDDYSNNYLDPENVPFAYNYLHSVMQHNMSGK
jgi:predicted membrane-bound spermidine synthase